MRTKGLRNALTLDASNAGEEAMQEAKGFSSLPMKEQALARAIVVGFAAELERDRTLRGFGA